MLSISLYHSDFEPDEPPPMDELEFIQNELQDTQNQLKKTKAALDIARKALIKIRDADAGAYINNPYAWFDGFARKVASIALINIIYGRE